MTHATLRPRFLRLFACLLVVALALPAIAQKITVTATNPNTAPQGTIGLNVTITGSGYSKGAKAQFFISGTTDPGGVTVNSTSYVSSSQLTANVTVSTTAYTGGFDVQVTSGTRTGKGTDMFTVTTNGSSGGCVTKGPAAGWTQVALLNPATNGTPLYTAGALGTAVAVQLVTIADGTQFYVGLAGSGNGASGNSQAIAFVLNLDGSVRRSWVAMNNATLTRDIRVGDFNADGSPDFVMGASNAGQAFVFLGHVTGGPGAWDYSVDPPVQLPTPANVPGGFGYRVAAGDLDGNPGDEVVVSAVGGGTGKRAQAGAAYIYQLNNGVWSILKTINDPAGGAGDHYGSGLAIGALTVDGSGAPVRDLAVLAGALGTVYVFQSPLGGTPPPTLTFSYTPAENTYADHAGAGDINGDGSADLAVVTGSGSGSQVTVFPGPLTQGETAAPILLPNPTYTTGWGTGFSIGDIDGDGRADVLVGAPNASYSSNCSPSPGAAFVFRSASGTLPSYSDMFQVPVVESSYMGFGWSMAAAPYNSTVAQPIVLIGENGALVGTQDGAGQVYIYRKTQ